MKNKKLALGIIAITFITIIALTLSKGNLSNILDERILGRTLGVITIMPTILTVVLAFVTKNVIFSLLIGFIAGVMTLALSSSQTLTLVPLEFVRQIFISGKEVVGDLENIKVLLLCFAVGGMIEVVRASGGFEALAIRLTKKIDNPRKACFIGNILGCLIFFDDYANSLIVGPIMKPITDRVKVSREKLAYIVDSTAAPVTGIAIVSSWVAVEISAIEQGLRIANMDGDGFSLFLGSVPFCFYCLLCLTFIFVNVMTGRDFGPMLKAETRARQGESVSEESKKLENDSKEMVNDKIAERIITGFGGIILLVVFSMVSFYIFGKKAAILDGVLNASSKMNVRNLIVAIGYADTTGIISIAAIIGALYVIILGLCFKLFDLKKAMSSWLKGVKSISETVVLLLFAWSLANTINRLGTAYFAIDIISMNVDWHLVPVLIFMTCCIISFAAGSFGCLFVVMPLAIPLAYQVMSLGVTNHNTYLLVCIGSVMAGSIFGDHCSPITDCTILSALGAGCSTMEHTKTQMPYAIVVAVISVIAIFATSLNVSVLLILSLGIIAEVLIFMLFGKKPE